MKKIKIRKSKTEGIGVFALRDIIAKEIVLTTDLSKKKKYSVADLPKVPVNDRNHLDPIGNGKYVVDHSDFSYVNHSCEPNTYVKEKNRKIKSLVALKDIKKSEEITYDYVLTAEPAEKWRVKCHCKTKICREFIDSDYYNLPKNLQKKYWAFLPNWKKRLLSKF